MKTPRYMRLADLLAAAITDGRLAPGARLLTHRAFAQEAGVALATATSAYRELEKRGLVAGEAGRGMFVRDLALPPALGTRQTEAQGLTDLVFNMPGDAGDSALLREGLRRLASGGDLEAMLRYQPHGGRAHERRIIAASLAPRLGDVDPDRLVLTSGGQHGLAILAMGLFRRGEAIATDALTYPGFRSIAALQGLDLVPVAGEAGVMAPEELERQCRKAPLRAVYLMPTVHNPLGSVMPEETRRHIVAIARKHDLLIIEDGAYAFLDPDPPPGFLRLAPERTIHVGGFSKSLATGLRLGYVIAPAPCLDRLLEAVRATTWNVPALISALVTGWIEDGTLAASEAVRRQDGAERQQLCRSALEDLGLFGHDNAGFAWLPLGQGLRAEPIVSSLKAQGILTSGAAAFATTSRLPQALRLAFGGVPKADLPRIFAQLREAVISASSLAARS